MFCTGICLGVWVIGFFGSGLVCSGAGGCWIGCLMGSAGGDHLREIVHGVVGKIGEMKGRLKVAVSVDGDRRIFGDMEVVLAGVVVEGGRMV